MVVCTRLAPGISGISRQVGKSGEAEQMSYGGPDTYGLQNTLVYPRYSLLIAIPENSVGIRWANWALDMAAPFKNGQVWQCSQCKPIFCDVKMTWRMAFAAHQTIAKGCWNLEVFRGDERDGVMLELLCGRVWSDRVCGSTPPQRHDVVSRSARAPNWFNQHCTRHADWKHYSSFPKVF